MTVLAAATSNIIQQTFRELELSPPSSFGDDSEQAQGAADRYEDALRICLEHADWSFARRIVSLPEAVPDPGFQGDPEFPHAFVLPSDTVMLRAVLTGSRWQTSDLYLTANTAGPLPIRYTRLVTNEARLPASFRLAVALELADQLAPKWMAQTSKRRALRDKADMQLRKAARNDARMQGSHGRWDGREGAFDWSDEAQS